MSSPQSQKTSDLQAVADALRSHDRFLLVTHENPDGDALGSLLAMKLALDSLGKDSEMYLYGDAPLPREYAFMPLNGLRREPPVDWPDRVLLALDCANEQRLGPDSTLLGRAPLTVDVDHHHDNSRFGDVNLIVPDASSTGEVLRDLFRELRVFQGVYESVEFGKLKLLARALERAQVYEGGRLVVSYLLRSDFTELNIAEAFSEGIIDYLRAVDGADMAALIREPPRREGPARRVSLRASTDELDVSAIARKSGGGGHRQAAGFSSDATIEEITDFIHREFARAAAGA